eukprot:PhM_4_TR14423/c0_g1_i1/m.24291
MNTPDMKGPTPTSNWLVQHKVLWGDMPNGEKLSKICECGVNLIVDLRPEGQNYVGDASGVRYVHFPIKNLLTGTPDHCEAIRSFTTNVLTDVNKGHTVAYIHDADGHSLSSTLAAGILAGQFGMSALKAMNVAAQLHALRVEKKGIDSLYIGSQRNLVRECYANYTPAIGGAGHALTPPRGETPVDPLQDTASSLASTGTRFANTRGFGGGESQLNIFTGENTSPSKTGRPGRKFITGVSATGGGTQHLHLFDQPSLSGSTPATPKVNLEATTTKPSFGTPQQQQQQQYQPQQHHHQQQQQQYQQQKTTPVRPQGVLRVPITRSTLDEPWGLDIIGLNILDVAPGSVCDRARVPSGEIVGISGLEIDHEDQLTILCELLEAELFIRPTPTNTHASPQTKPMQQNVTAPSPTVHHQHPTTTTSHGGQITQYGSNVPSAQHAPSSFELPPLLDARRDQSAIQGPTPTSNWVVRGSLLCGPKPNPRDKKRFHALLDTGISVFVNLMEDADCSYVEAAEAATLRTFSAMCFPIPDDGIPDPSQVGNFAEFINDILEQIYAGRRVYVHCREGHGRTGIVIAVLLGKLYGLSGMKATSLCSSLHRGRVDDGGHDSPRTLEQRTFVQMFLNQ